MIGQTISHYRVTAELGAGGMGVVYRAEDLRLGRPVAIKFLPDSAAANPQALERFHREARAASALNHRHICTIHEIDEHAGRPFIVMEILEGETLQNRIARKRFDLESLLDVTMQVAEGLEAAHAKGHRPPRHQALQHLRDERGRGKDSGLRAGEACRGWRRRRRCQLLARHHAHVAGRR